MISSPNEISILRKRVVVNIPGFSDETNTNQNEWFKLYDLTCVDITRAESSKIFSMEDTPNDQNNMTTDWLEFWFESARQTAQMPYDIKTGDYVGYYQQGQRKLWRIMKVETNQLLPNCCVIRLITTITYPRETETDISCGATRTIPDGEIEDD